ncbi:splicing factor 3A subunit [Thraustotheca clavata]|uniref:Splicing factor 3A subunit n=1 Tax=Thraustotheca clavata TaxID=74557 RepID=A0A1W0A306_9STRA|nr:splicing factor 3A subunit [Thraustotheca clavata]
MDVFVRGIGSKEIHVIVQETDSVNGLKYQVSKLMGIPASLFNLAFNAHQLIDANYLSDYGIVHGSTLNALMSLKGGMDFQNRVGTKFGGGGVMSEQQANIDRRERLRKLALETVDLSKDPYILKNHLGTFECKLCLTLHSNEGNYLAHTQGKRHQTNLARRAAKDAAEASASVPPPQKLDVPKIRTIKIGLPGYKVTKQRDPDTGARMLLFQIFYPDIMDGYQPRHRFMSAFEQRVEVADKNFQYLLFACEPYETIAFKIPNLEVDKSDGKFYTNWDKSGKSFTLHVAFVPENTNK